MMKAERRERERDRLRLKRADPAYLRAQQKRRARQMRAVREVRKRAGKCHDCNMPRTHGVYCAKHHAYERARQK